MKSKLPVVALLLALIAPHALAQKSRRACGNIR